MTSTDYVLMYVAQYSSYTFGVAFNNYCWPDRFSQFFFVMADHTIKQTNGESDLTSNHTRFVCSYVAIYSIKLCVG